MADIRLVLSKSFELLNVRLTFGSFSFTMFQFWLAIFVLSLVVWFINKVFC